MKPIALQTPTLKVDYFLVASHTFLHSIFDKGGSGAAAGTPLWIFPFCGAVAHDRSSFRSKTSIFDFKLVIQADVVIERGWIFFSNAVTHYWRSYISSSWRQAWLHSLIRKFCLWVRCYCFCGTLLKAPNVASVTTHPFVQFSFSNLLCQCDSEAELRHCPNIFDAKAQIHFQKFIYQQNELSPYFVRSPGVLSPCGVLEFGRKSAGHSQFT